LQVLQLAALSAWQHFVLHVPDKHLSLELQATPFDKLADDVDVLPVLLVKEHVQSLCRV
jgi:hypothetical protein